MAQDYAADRDTYETVFTHIRVALQDLDRYEQWEDTFEQAKEDALDDGKMEDDNVAGMAEMLIQLYSHSQDMRETTRETIERKDGLEDHYEKKGDQEKEHDAKRERNELENRKKEYQHNIDAALEGMRLLDEMTDDRLTYAELEEVAEQDRSDRGTSSLLKTGEGKEEGTREAP